MNISRKRLYIGGMTCVSCQNKIEKALKKTPGVESAKISYQKGTADIAFDPDWVTLEELQKVIRDTGYEVLQEPAAGKTDFGRTATLLILIFFLYRMLQHSGILNLLVPSELADTGMGYGMLFVIGLLTSVHCIAMCGGINLSQCIGRESGENQGFAAFRPSFLYNLGRVISYTGIGFILGCVGMFAGSASGAGVSPLFQGILKMIAGVLMVIMGINMLGIFPGLRRFTLRMPKFLAVKVNQKKAKSHQPFVVGLLNGLMPCGPLQSMQIVALASGNPVAGALSMLAFSLGTVPLMLGLGSFVTMLGKRFSAKVMETGAVLVVVLGLAMLSQGGNLSGLFYGGMGWNQAGQVALNDASAGAADTASGSGKAGTRAQADGAAGRNGADTGNDASKAETSGTAESGTDELEGNESDAAGAETQVIRSTLTGGRYPNITVTAGIPVKWIIDVPAGALNGCNYRMLLNAYGIAHTFSEGENIIEFTPEKTGTVPYTCWMGMIRGNIFVTDGISKAPQVSDVQPDTGTGGFGSSGMGCCGGGF